jgi:hypothetical protein
LKKVKELEGSKFGKWIIFPSTSFFRVPAPSAKRN